ncbi:MAG: hypothetical protein K2K60_06990 [Clostridia bacterium]|nr:hypothetical protein [Clostridia bacterium]
MGGYTKNIAVIRGLKSGFSADGGLLSGLVKAEKYGSELKVEVSLINFAPLSEGRYVCAVSDGKSVQVIEGTAFEGASEVDTSLGFAALICFVNGTVSPVASAVCGNFQSAALGIKEEIEKRERLNIQPQKSAEPAYEDEALAQENYYEYEQTDESCRAVCEDKNEKEIGRSVRQDEAAFSAVKGKGGQDGVEIPLAHGACFFDKMKGEIENVLQSYPKEDGLESTVENSRWVKIDYGDKKYYVFGVIYGGGKPQYICYGVPSTNSRRPPESLEGMSSYIPSADGKGGYWVMYQDAATGASVKVEAE